MEASGADAKRAIDREVLAHVRAGRCDEATGLADSFRAGWGEAFAGDAVTRAERCVKRAASEADVDHGAEIFAAHTERDYKRATELCAQQLPKLKQFVEFCVVSACALKNTTAAKRWFRSLPRSSQTIVPR